MPLLQTQYDQEQGGRGGKGSGKAGGLQQSRDLPVWKLPQHLHSCERDPRPCEPSPLPAFRRITPVRRRIQAPLLLCFCLCLQLRLRFQLCLRVRLCLLRAGWLLGQGVFHRPDPPRKGPGREQGILSYNSRGTEFDVLLCAQSHNNRSPAARIPSPKRSGAGFSQQKEAAACAEKLIQPGSSPFFDFSILSYSFPLGTVNK